MSEIMKGYWKNDAMRSVFKYLKGDDLQNAYLVCKSWSEIGKCKNMEKSPFCKTLTKRKMEENQNFVSTIKDIIQFLITKPSFCMFMINDVLKYDNSESCYCELLPYNCYFILLKTPAPQNEMLRLSSTIFPEVSNMQITNYIFYASLVTNSYYCPELRSNFNCCFHKYLDLKHHFDWFLQKKCNNVWKCLILWCKKGSLRNFTSLIKTLADWYAPNEVIVWGGVAETLTVCNKNANLKKCRRNMDFTFSFINNQNLEVESLVLDQDCTDKELIEEKFNVLSERITLKKHSIAFMYTSYFRFDDFYEFKSFLFKKYFPSVKLIHTVGKEPFGGNGFVELSRRLEKPQLEGNTLHLALMILTYN